MNDVYDLIKLYKTKFMYYKLIINLFFQKQKVQLVDKNEFLMH